MGIFSVRRYNGIAEKHSRRSVVALGHIYCVSDEFVVPHRAQHCGKMTACGRAYNEHSVFIRFVFFGIVADEFHRKRRLYKLCRKARRAHNGITEDETVVAFCTEFKRIRLSLAVGADAVSAAGDNEQSGTPALCAVVCNIGCYFHVGI